MLYPVPRLLRELQIAVRAVEALVVAVHHLLLRGIQRHLRRRLRIAYLAITRLPPLQKNQPLDQYPDFRTASLTHKDAVLVTV